MTRISMTALALMVGAATGLALAASAAAQQKKIVIGVQCDRTGPTQIVGTVLCPAMHDYFKLHQCAELLDGYTIDAPTRSTTAYKVPPAVEAYERQKQQGAVIMAVYGTPQTARAERAARKGQDPGDDARLRHRRLGRRARNIPICSRSPRAICRRARRRSSSPRINWAAASKARRSPISIIDNPAGKEPLPVIEDLQKTEGFELRTFAVPPPGVEMGAQMLDITQRYHPDFVIIASVRPLAVGVDQGVEGATAIRCRRCSGWSGPRPRPTSWRPAAGGSPRATTRCSSPAPATTIRCARKSRRCTRRRARRRRRRWTTRSIYNRGLLQAAIQVEAIRNALKLTRRPSSRPARDVKKGFEQIHDFTLGGLVPPLQITRSRSRRRRLGADLPGQGRQVRPGDRLVPRLPRRRDEDGARPPRRPNSRLANTRIPPSTVARCWRSTTSKSSMTASSWC